MKLFSFFVGAATAISASAALAEFNVTILHTNDIHSRIESINKYDSTCNSDGEAERKCFGGIARIKSAIDMQRSELSGQNILVLDAGDPFQGSLFYTTYKGAAEAKFMEAIGYDAMAVGNHEFDDGPEGLAKFIDAVSFPVVSGNLDLSQEPVLKNHVKDSVVINVGGQKIGIVSALATDTVDTSSPGDNVKFIDEIEALKEDVAAMEANGVNKIIALTHVGLPMDIQIAKSVPGIDLIIGGHSHTKMLNEEGSSHSYPEMIGNVPVVQAYAYSKYLGKLTVSFDGSGNITSASGDPILLDASIVPDEETAKSIAEMAAPIEEMKKKIVAKAASDIDGDRANCRVRECHMGNLVTDAMLERVSGQGVEIAIQNGGGLRASIGSGDITMGDVLTVLPFQNTLSTFEVTGETIIAALENGVSQMEEVKGRFPQVAGISFVVNPSAKVGSRISEVLVGGSPIDRGRTYKVVSNNYVRNGGDGYKMFRGAANAYDYGPDLADVTAEFLAKQNDYRPYLDGRIKVTE
jgi:5'-nucleotidase